jgi:hypothetical protein
MASSPTLHAVVPGAKVTLTDVDRNQVYKTDTNAVGSPRYRTHHWSLVGVEQLGQTPSPCGFRWRRPNAAV